VSARLAIFAAVAVGLVGTSFAEGLPDHVEHKVYSVRAAAASTRVGQPANVVVTVETRVGYHLNDEYPIHFTPQASANVKFDKARYDREGGKRVACAEGGHACRASLLVDFIAGAPGQVSVGGTLAFSACSDAQCLIEKIDIAAPVSVAR
jgi:hypothetical protein